MENKENMDIEKEFQHYLDIFKKDKELGKALSLVSFPALFNNKFLQEHSKFTSLNDLVIRSGFGIMNLLEVENVNQEKWNAYIAKNSSCTTWYEFGKLAMIEWMKAKIEEVKNRKGCEPAWILYCMRLKACLPSA